ncbi:glutaminase [Actinokineospora inagensis]|uniref:glutaminase n=1 Tax=Actinokineospora inagensis TaxID=103730 RepID=UPI00041C5A12|nr:glutaminase [Actinokineospora inagensis]
MQGVLEQVAAGVRSVVGQGKQAVSIPALARVPLNRFGMAVATADGDVVGVGDWDEPFSVQSLSKLFTLALAGDMRDRVGREPSTLAFNSLSQLELDEGRPRNPFLNAGALVTTDQLLSTTGDAAAALRGFLAAESGAEVAVDLSVAESELETGHRNAALAHLIAGYGNLHNPVTDVLRNYVHSCAIAMSCRDLALAGLFLARTGRGRATQVLSASDARRLNATMLVCGMYDGAGEFAYRVGLPAKSGIGGGVLAVVPNRCVVCVWSPGLDRCGNSVAAVAALEIFSALTGYSVF